MKGRGGYSRPESPSEFTFPDTVTSAAKFPITNPTRIAGVLAWKADPLSGDVEHLNTNGTNRMKNTLRLDGDNEHHDLVGVKDITASGRLEVTGGEHGSAGGMTVDKDTVIRGNLTVEGEARPNSLTVKQKTQTNTLSVIEETQTDTLYFTKSHNAGERCSREWSTGQNKNGEMVQCRKGRWQALNNKGLYWRHHEYATPNGFWHAATKFYWNLGYYHFCVDVQGQSILWAENGFWKSSVFGNSGLHRVICFGDQK